MKPYIIKELIIDGEEQGIKAISLVDEPAIETNFVYFKHQNNIELRSVDVGGGYIVDLDEFWEFTADPEPPTIATSHQFCIDHVDKVYHIDEIRAWDRFKPSYKNGPSGFITQSNFFATFNGVNSVSFNGDEQVYNCRHWLRRVRKISQLSQAQITQYRKKTPLNINQSSNTKFSNEVQFAVDVEKKEIAGAALIPGKMIYRNSIPGWGEPGYVYVSKSTIKALKEKYGFNRSLTIQHQDDVTGKAILLDSWIYPEKPENYGIDVPDGTWFLKFKIIDNKLWEVIKERKVVGFSIEAMLQAI